MHADEVAMQSRSVTTCNRMGGACCSDAADVQLAAAFWTHYLPTGRAARVPVGTNDLSASPRKKRGTPALSEPTGNFSSFRQIRASRHQPSGRSA
jgi:hypothetical protein